MTSKIFWPLFYVAMILFCNWLITVTPMIMIAGSAIPPVMLVVGFVFVIRDFAQRAIGHWIIPAMFIAALLSYWLASPFVALASAAAFLTSEIIDWAVYTFTGKPIYQRVLLSSAFAVPVDTIIFLTFLGIFDWVGVIIISILKFLSAVLCWWFLKKYNVK